MNKFHWIEAKQLDNVTNYSTELEPIKFALNNNIDAFYYCTFREKKRTFGLSKNIIYLGFFKNRYIKFIEFQFRVFLKSIFIVLFEKHSVIMVNQKLIKNIIPALFINKIFIRRNKFVIDVRTTPVNPESFNKDMKSFNRSFKYAIKYFDGFSFITPFMEKYLMRQHSNQKIKSVNWSSGVDVSLFNPNNFIKTQLEKPFTLFYHGGISVSRGNLDLIKACEILINKNYNIQLIQVGVLVDMGIKNYIKNQNLENWCHLLPPVSLNEVPQMIIDCDLPVIPFPNFMGWRVSSPIKLMEYLAMGKKVLAPNIEAFTDVFFSYPELVHYFNANSSNQIIEMSTQIGKIIDESAKIKSNQLECINFVRSNYTWEIQAKKLFNFCLDL